MADPINHPTYVGYEIFRDQPVCKIGFAEVCEGRLVCASGIHIRVHCHIVTRSSKNIDHATRWFKDSFEKNHQGLLRVYGMTPISDNPEEPIAVFTERGNEFETFESWVEDEADLYDPVRPFLSREFSKNLFFILETLYYLATHWRMKHGCLSGRTIYVVNGYPKLAWLGGEGKNDGASFSNMVKTFFCMKGGLRPYEIDSMVDSLEYDYPEDINILYHSLNHPAIMSAEARTDYRHDIQEVLKNDQSLQDHVIGLLEPQFGGRLWTQKVMSKSLDGKRIYPISCHVFKHRPMGVNYDDSARDFVRFCRNSDTYLPPWGTMQLLDRELNTLMPHFLVALHSALHSASYFMPPRHREGLFP